MKNWRHGLICITFDPSEMEDFSLNLGQFYLSVWLLRDLRGYSQCEVMLAVLKIYIFSLTLFFFNFSIMRWTENEKAGFIVKAKVTD